jgi:hypothetical protein
MQATIGDIRAYIESEPLVHLGIATVLLLIGAVVGHVFVKFALRRVTWVVAARLGKMAAGVVQDDVLFGRLALLAPTLIVYQGVALLPDVSPVIPKIAQRGAVVAAIAIGLGTLTHLLFKGNEIYCRYPISRSRPIKFAHFALLKDYIHAKRSELAEYNRERTGSGVLVANARRLTNVGTFRAYLFAYLRQHPAIHQAKTLLVRQLHPTSEGLPLEIYVFTKDVRWVHYEAAQADIFDHIFAVIEEFGLRVYQKPSGCDVRELQGDDFEGRVGRGAGKRERPARIGTALPAE